MPRGNAEGREAGLPVVEYHDGRTSNGKEKGKKKEGGEKKRAVKCTLDKRAPVPPLPFHHSRTSRIRQV